MAAKYVIDTHTLLWFLGDNPRLGAGADSILYNPDNDLIVPTVVLAEACWTVEKGRTPVTVPTILGAIDEDPRIEVFPHDIRMSEVMIGRKPCRHLCYASCRHSS